MKTNKNKKWYFSVRYDFVLGDSPEILKAQEAFYCVDRELEDLLDLIERTIIRCGGQVMDTKISRA